MADPRFCGGPQGSVSPERCETQMSNPPAPPGRVELKYKLSSFFESVGAISGEGELIVAPRLTGADHFEKSGADPPTVTLTPMTATIAYTICFTPRLMAGSF